MSKKDLRLKILEHFNNLKKSTSEINTNSWLEKQHSDLGTIRRSIIELVESDLLAVSEKNKEDAIIWLKEVIDSTTRGFNQEERENKKSSKRLTRPMGKFEEVPDLKLYTTLKGILFIQEYHRFKNQNVNKLVFMILGILLGLGAAYAKEYFTESHSRNKSEANIEKKCTKNDNTSNIKQKNKTPLTSINTSG